MESAIQMGDPFENEKKELDSHVKDALEWMVSRTASEVRLFVLKRGARATR